MKRNRLSRQYPSRPISDNLDSINTEIDVEQEKLKRQKEIKHAEACRLRYHKRRARGKCGVAGCEHKSKKSVCKYHMNKIKERWRERKNKKS